MTENPYQSPGVEAGGQRPRAIGGIQCQPAFSLFARVSYSIAALFLCIGIWIGLFAPVKLDVRVTIVCWSITNSTTWIATALICRERQLLATLACLVGDLLAFSAAVLYRYFTAELF